MLIYKHSQYHGVGLSFLHLDALGTTIFGYGFRPIKSPIKDMGIQNNDSMWRQDQCLHAFWVLTWFLLNLHWSSLSGCKINSLHGDVIKWKHVLRYWSFVRGIHRSPVNSSYKGQWCGALVFTLICDWINGWVNNRKAGVLRRRRAHYDVIVMPMECKKFHQHLKSWL